MDSYHHCSHVMSVTPHGHCGVPPGHGEAEHLDVQGRDDVVPSDKAAAFACVIRLQADLGGQVTGLVDLVPGRLVQFAERCVVAVVDVGRDILGEVLLPLLFLENTEVQLGDPGCLFDREPRAPLPRVAELERTLSFFWANLLREGRWIEVELLCRLVIPAARDLLLDT